MKNNDYYNVGSRIREVRLERHMTINELAEEVGCAAHYLCRLENGYHGCSLDLAGRLSNALGVSIDYLKFGVESIDYSKKKIYELLLQILQYLKKLGTE